MEKVLSVEIIRKCMNNCIHCSSCSTSTSTEILTIDTIQNIILDAKNNGFTKICLSGGEPLLHPNILEIINSIKDNGLKCTIYTCGIYEDPEILFKIYDQCGNDITLIYSVHTLDDDEFKIISNTDNDIIDVLNMINVSLTLGFNTEVHIVPMKMNIDDLASIISCLKHIGVTQVSLLRLILHGRAVDNSRILSLDLKCTADLKLKLTTLKNMFPFIRIGIPLMGSDKAKCTAGVQKIYIRYDGAVLPCESFKYIDIHNRHCIVEPMNIKYTSLSYILKHSEYLKLATKYVDDYNSCDHCESCPIQNLKSNTLDNVLKL